LTDGGRPAFQEAFGVPRAHAESGRNAVFGFVASKGDEGGADAQETIEDG
ncbi:hypothetical protein LCGC14_2893260, partial [marine sediment metagenome]